MSSDISIPTLCKVSGVDYSRADGNAGSVESLPFVVCLMSVCQQVLGIVHDFDVIFVCTLIKHIDGFRYRVENVGVDDDTLQEHHKAVILEVELLIHLLGGVSPPFSVLCHLLYLIQFFLGRYKILRNLKLLTIYVVQVLTVSEQEVSVFILTLYLFLVSCIAVVFTSTTAGLYGDHHALFGYELVDVLLV